ncbi:MAG: NAD+ synthase [Candidatus Hydrogenedentes bacterium]|nr:NAD+ synthase [Candidatus Hydrogenedentota bacterium]
MNNDELTINCELADQILCGFIRNETEKVGVENVVLGVSGGVDSATSVALAARALGPEHVLGVRMPYATSLPESAQDAALVIEQFGIESITIEITDMVDGYLNAMNVTDRTRRGNVMARARMIVLYDQSAARDALVLGTSNKTEYLLGYSTLWGDMACAINPLGDLYKTQVWQIAEYLGVPDRVIKKPPTADLWAGQTDEDELGFSYRDADRILYHLVDRRCGDAELIELGFTPEFIELIRTRIQRTQYKRRMPIIAKLSHRTVDRDFRYPRDWRG